MPGIVSLPVGLVVVVLPLPGTGQTDSDRTDVETGTDHPHPTPTNPIPHGQLVPIFTCLIWTWDSWTVGPSLPKTVTDVGWDTWVSGQGFTPHPLPHIPPSCLPCPPTVSFPFPLPWDHLPPPPSPPPPPPPHIAPHLGSDDKTDGDGADRGRPQLPDRQDGWRPFPLCLPPPPPFPSLFPFTSPSPSPFFSHLFGRTGIDIDSGSSDSQERGGG